MNSSDTSRTPPNPLNAATQIRITVKGMGHVPSFKTQKRGGFGFRKDGSKYPMARTNPKHAEWKERCCRLIELQLKSLFQTIGSGILTEHSAHFSTAYAMLSTGFDDRWQRLPEIRVSAVPVDAGNEGAEIIIEKIV